MSAKSPKGFAQLLRDAQTEGDRANQINDTKARLIVTDSAPAETPPAVQPQTTVTTDNAPPAAQLPTLDDFKSIVEAALSAQKAENDAKLEATKAEADAKLKQALDAAEQERAKSAALNDAIARLGLDKFIGQSQPKPPEAPMVNRVTSVYSDRYPGAVADFMSIRDSAPKIQTYSQRSGDLWSYDQREIAKFVRDNKKQLISDMETWGKRMGLFRGPSRVTTDAATTAADITGGFLETLSAIMRSNNRPGFIFHQFARTRVDFAARQGTTIDVPRSPYMTPPSTIDDRRLSGGGTFVPTDPARQRIVTGVAQVTVEEWGLGKDSTCPPVGIPTFVEAFSMIDLMAILNRNLVYDYYSWEDLLVYELWDRTSRVVYNDRGAVTTTATDVGTGDDGTLTQTFLNNLFAYMRSLQIPTYENNCYGLVVNDYSLAQLKNSLDDFSLASKEELEEISNVLQADTATGEGEGDRASGFVMRLCGFMIFESNNFGMGAAGTKGAQNVTIGTGSVLTRSNFAFGASTVARGVALPMEIRRDNVTNFGRLGSYIWLEQSGIAALDVDPTGFSDASTVAQQLRVVEVRTTAAAV